ncbi:MAG: GNAT family N-acetyltransferase [Gemmatimonadetes bacterium]|nr:GNAT family N-acetyltransferase [Gemmatimonadota bacterium]
MTSDLTLAQRLERTEARSNAAFVEARARLMPEVGAAWQDFEGTYAMFDGVGSPLTQSFGLGVFGEVTDAHLAALEQFFDARGAASQHEMSVLAGNAALAPLAARGYRPIELSTVLCQPVVDAPPAALPPSLRVRAIAADEVDRWAATSAAGWGETPELAAFMLAFGRVAATAAGCVAFLAEWDGEPIAAAAMNLHHGTALLAGAATIPAWRGRGAQAALLGARLHHAARAGCDLAMMAAEPGSTSQRNAERQGFRVAYNRIKWGKE